MSLATLPTIKCVLERQPSLLSLTCTIHNTINYMYIVQIYQSACYLMRQWYFTPIDNAFILCYTNTHVMYTMHSCMIYYDYTMWMAPKLTSQQLLHLVQNVLHYLIQVMYVTSELFFIAFYQWVNLHHNWCSHQREMYRRKCRVKAFSNCFYHCLSLLQGSHW